MRLSTPGNSVKSKRDGAWIRGGYRKNERTDAAESQEHGVAPEKYASSILQEALVSPIRGFGKLTVEELHLMLRQIVEGSEKLPNLQTSAFTRESFYEDDI